MGIIRLDKLDDDFKAHFNNWVESKPVKINYHHSTEEIISHVMKLAIAHGKEKRNDLLQEEVDLTLLPSPWIF